MFHFEKLAQFQIIMQVEMGFSPCAMLIVPFLARNVEYYYNIALLGLNLQSVRGMHLGPIRGMLLLSFLKSNHKYKKSIKYGYV